MKKRRRFFLLHENLMFLSNCISVEVTDLLFDKVNEDVESGALWNNRRSRAEE